MRRACTSRCPRGAGHDAQILAQMLPSAMLFVPSIGGISHHYAENTRDEDIVLGCQVSPTRQRRFRQRLRIRRGRRPLRGSGQLNLTLMGRSPGLPDRH